MALRKIQLEDFKQRLKELRAHILNNIRGTVEDVKVSEDSRGFSQHQADEGTDDFGRTINFELGNTERKVLKQVDRALEKLREKSYGVCDMTGKSIPLKRLEAIPYANITVEAQEKIEKGLM